MKTDKQIDKEFDKLIKNIKKDKEIIICLILIFILTIPIIIAQNKIEKNMTPREHLVRKCKNECSRVMGKDYVYSEMY